MACDGSGSVLEQGDVMLPEHGLSMATGYDDAFNQTPERLLRNVLALGYRGDINHYVGMSHYFRLEALGSGLYVSLTGGTFNAPCAAWHRDFAARAKALGLGVIRSEEQTSELQSLMRHSYAVCCLKKKNNHNNTV